MTEVWDDVIDTSLKPKKVGAFDWLALVLCQCSDYKKA